MIGYSNVNFRTDMLINNTKTKPRNATETLLKHPQWVIRDIGFDVFIDVNSSGNFSSMFAVDNEHVRGRLFTLGKLKSLGSCVYLSKLLKLINLC